MAYTRSSGAIATVPLNWEECQLVRIALASGITSQVITGSEADDAWHTIGAITLAMDVYQESFKDDDE